MIFSLRSRSRANRVGFYTIPYIQAHILALALLTPESLFFWRRKESPHVLDHFESEGRWMAVGWPLDGRYLYFLSVWLNIIALIPIRQYFSMIWFLAVGWNIEPVNLLDEAVNLWIFTVGLTSSRCWPHTSSVWPWSGMPKVCLSDTFLGGLHQNSALRVTSYRRTYKNQIFFWFMSNAFLKRPVSLKYWLLRPLSTRKPHAKAVPSKDYFTHLRTLKNARKGRRVGPNYHASHPRRFWAVWDDSCSKIWHPSGLTLRCMPYGRGTLRIPLQRIQ